MAEAATAQQTETSCCRVIANSVPKSGTYLLSRTLELVGLRRHDTVLTGVMTPRSRQIDETADAVLVGSDWPCLVANTDFEALLERPGADDYLLGHLPHSPRVRGMLHRRHIRMVLMIRDPRDIAVSHARWALSQNYLPQHEIYRRLSPGDRLKISIIGLPPTADGPVLTSLRQRLLHMLPWVDDPSVYTTRFERLVGPQGGGDPMAQHAEIANILAHLDMTGADVNAVAEGVFGGTLTFKGGQIGRWRDAFDESHKRLIKSQLGDILVRLGYEHDNDW